MEKNKIVKITEPIDPEIVFLGLIFVNFGPLNILPKIKPPISEPAQHISKEKMSIFNCTKWEKIKKIEQKLKT